MRTFNLHLACLFFVLLGVTAVQAQGPEPNSAPPRSDESSSRDTMIDLRPPMGDEKSHPNSGVADDVMEMKQWNPMKAMKNLEIGDYYFKQKNYRAAESRYREALEWKPNDAEATFKLATVLEKLGEAGEARSSYESYLKILPTGPHAEESKKALSRIPKADKPPQVSAEKTAPNR
jgi:tetratricopeptide (TPR) repeat protein